MYSIGMFSQICRVTTKTLRHYDEIGLLRPCHTDEQTGYRYYTSAQLAPMHRILSLKQMGFSLQEIRAILEGGPAVEAMLAAKQRELSAQIDDARHRLLLIENFMSCGKGAAMNNRYTATIKQLPEVTVASIRRILPDYSALNDVYPNVLGPEMERLGCRCAQPDYCFNLYHDGEYKDHDIDVEICQAVTEKKADSELLKFKTLAPVTAVCVLHKGPYALLGDAYAFALDWVRQNGYRVCGIPRESYIDGIWNKESENDYLTELQFPVETA